MRKCWIEFRIFYLRYVSNDYGNEHGNLGNKSYWHLMSPMIMVIEHGNLGNKFLLASYVTNDYGNGTWQSWQ